jgi:predicted AAA+ superfamily ATPase
MFKQTICIFVVKLRIMNQVMQLFRSLLATTKTDFVRNYLRTIPWRSRLIGIKGARGVGKTTLLLQYIKLHLMDQLHQTLYVSMDHIYFYRNTLVDLADEFHRNGGKFLFLDEVHKYPNWSIEIKNIYDQYPNMQVVFTGSSMLEIINSQADLSRRTIICTMQGLSYREYLNMKLGMDLPIWTLDDILHRHTSLTMDIAAQINPLAHFGNYLSSGYYPYFLEDELRYVSKVQQVLQLIIEVELPLLRNVKMSSVHQLKQLLALISETVPLTPNVSKISSHIGLNRETLIHYFYYLQEAGITQMMYYDPTHISSLQKPDKLLLDNTNIQFALANQQPNKGTMRETFFVNQLKVVHRVNLSDFADYTIDGLYHFEIGGASKSKKQIYNKDNAFVVKDDMEHGAGNAIPLWVFGFMY